MIIRRVGVLSLAKLMGGAYGVLGFVIGAIFSLAAMAGAAIGGAHSNEPGAAAIGALLGVGAIVALPIAYGLMGFLAGLFSAFLYNLFAGVFGGVELVVDASAAPSPLTAPPQASPFS